MTMGTGERPAKPSEKDLEDLRRAKTLLENPGLPIRIANYLGKPVEQLVDWLPKGAKEVVSDVTRSALEVGLGLAIRTMDQSSFAEPHDFWHKVGVAVTGMTGGAVGFAALPLELPVSTVVMLRSIGAHAAAQGENLRTPEARLSCLTVFALGGNSSVDDAGDAGYFAIRATLAKALVEATEYLVERGAAEALAKRSAPVLGRLVASIASRYEPVVVGKAAAQAAPVVGALGGAAINYLFIDHFQDMAWGHFTIRRLERTYGTSAVKAAYMTTDIVRVAAPK